MTAASVEAGNAKEPTATCRVSVVIPAFNAEDTVEACVRSVLGQRLKPVEVIVVDDASTDTTAWRASQLGVRVLRMLANGGPGLARNAGAASAAGDYVAFIDSDCVARPDWLESMVAQLDAEGVGAVTGGYAGPLTNDFLPVLQDRVLRVRQATLPRRIGSTISSNLVCRRNFFVGAGGFPLYFRRADPQRAVWGNEDEEFGFVATGGRSEIVWSQTSSVLHAYRPTLGTYLRQQRFYAERIVMSYLWRPSMAMTHTNYSRGSGMVDLAVTGLVPLSSAALLASIAVPSWSMAAAGAVALSLVMFAGLPLTQLSALRADGASRRFILKAYPVLLAVKVAWFVGAVRGLSASLGGFIDGSSERRISPPAFVVETRPAGASHVLRDSSLQRGVQALLLLGQSQPGADRTDP